MNGKAIKERIESNILIVIAGFVVAAFLAGAKFWAPFESKDLLNQKELLEKQKQALESDKQRLEAQIAAQNADGGVVAMPPLERAPLSRPIRVGIFGPLTGGLRSFGLSQARGLLSGIQHILHDSCGIATREWRRYFELTFYDTSKMLNMDAIATEFQQAQAREDLIFGPIFSEEALELFVRRKIDLTIPVVLTTAATPEVRKHPQYGTRLFQLADNIDVYAEQFMRYVVRFSEPRPTKVYCLFQDDEYGRSSCRALAKFAAQDNLAFLDLPLAAASSGNSASLKAGLGPLREKGDEVASLGDRAAIFIAALGDPLPNAVKTLHSKYPRARLLTMTSLSDAEIADGRYEGLYIAYSFVPRLYSVGTLAFFQYANLARVDLEDQIRSRIGSSFDWPQIGSVDAEVHDAAVYWIGKFVVPRLTAACRRDDWRSFTVTNFIAAGSGPTLGDEAPLYLFRIANRQMLPIEVSVGN